MVLRSKITWLGCGVLDRVKGNIVYRDTQRLP